MVINIQMDINKATFILLLVLVLNGLTMHQKTTKLTRQGYQKTMARGNPDGTPYDWSYQGDGKLIGISAKAGNHINELQFHFSDGTNSPIIGGINGYPYQTYSIQIPESKVVSQFVYRVDSEGMYSIDVLMTDGQRIGLGNLQEGHDKYVHFNLNGGRLIGLYGTLNQKGYINSIGLITDDKGISYGTGTGIPYYWKDNSVGNLVKITGRAKQSLNGIQLHFSDGKNTPYIGGFEGCQFEIDFTEDPLAEVTFRSIQHADLLSVDFVKESGQRVRLGDKTDKYVNQKLYDETTLIVDRRRIVAMFGTTDYDNGYINNLGFDLA